MVRGVVKRCGYDMAELLGGVVRGRGEGAWLRGVFTKYS